MEKNLLWDTALHKLKEGNARFVEDKLNNPNHDLGLRTVLSKGQHPWAIVLSCADSRVVPELAFDTGLGDLFVIRVAGNIANSSTIASIEYAVAHLDVNLIVVMGHQDCGAITAAVAGGDAGSSHLNHLVEHMQPALKACGHGCAVNDVVKKNAELTAEELAAKSEIIQNEIQNGELKVFSAYYHLDSGQVDFFEEA
jgi:carbonic anhydrase